VPLTSGFFAKFYAITAAVEAGSTWLAVIAMLTAVIAAFLYLRIIVAMYMADHEEETGARRTIPIPFAAGLALTVCAAVTLVVGLFPGVLSTPAKDATPVLVHEAADDPVADAGALAP
jgi:NADH-quinone oxidoreductase subunit N